MSKSIEAECIKGLIVDYLLANHKDIVIGNEVMYGSARKVADLVAILDDELIAIEVKSEKDNLYRLSGQISAYQSVFDRVIVFSASKHLNSIKKIIPEGVGLFEINNSGHISKIQKSKVNHKQAKEEMLLTMNSSYLKKHIAKGYLLNSDDVRTHLKRQRKENLRVMLREYFLEKIKRNFNNFMSDRGAVTSVDDIPMLSSGLFIQTG